MDIMYHDVLTAVKYNLNSKGYKFNLNKKSINKLFINEIAILGKKIS
jgi:hypothetical protein